VDPRVSFVVTNYNYGRFLGHAVDSLLEQSFEAVEVIIVDDFSTDDSPDAIAHYQQDNRVRVIQHTQNRGSIYSYNEGLAAARGEYVGVFDADDYAMEPDAVARQVALFDSDPRVGLVYSCFLLVDEHDEPFRELEPHRSEGVRDGLAEFAALIFMNTVPHSGTLVRRSCHDVVGFYNPDLPYAGDWDLWLRLSARFAVGYIAQPLYTYRVHRNNMTSRGKPPGEHTAERLAALRNGFAALPPDAPVELRRLEKRAERATLLCGTWNDRSFGRVRRSWDGLVDAVRRSPSLLATHEPYAAAAKLGLLALLGSPRYEQFAARRKALG
jgi:glycosyltransferase involved in cell wall biosynthesis